MSPRGGTVQQTPLYSRYGKHSFAIHLATRAAWPIPRPRLWIVVAPRLVPLPVASASPGCCRTTPRLPRRRRVAPRLVHQRRNAPRLPCRLCASTVAVAPRRASPVAAASRLPHCRRSAPRLPRTRCVVVCRPATATVRETGAVRARHGPRTGTSHVSCLGLLAVRLSHSCVPDPTYGFPVKISEQ